MSLVPGSIWRHTKKGLEYLVIVIGRNVDTMKNQVVYRQMYPFHDRTIGLPDYGIWVRDQKQFLEKVKINDEIVPRFTYVGNSF